VKNSGRTRTTLATAVIGAIAASLTGVFAAAQQPAAVPAAASAAGADQHLATMKQYCATCHNDRARTADVSFEGISATSIAAQPDVFETAIRKMRGRVMPPPGARQPSPEAIDGVVAWLEDTLDASAGQAHISDRLILHRLNRKEYRHAVRDLLATTIAALAKRSKQPTGSTRRRHRRRPRALSARRSFSSGNCSKAARATSSWRSRSEATPML
jgi:mono/diheme cytochrome c family protein